jgi:hypothetical protein
MNMPFDFAMRSRRFPYFLLVFLAVQVGAAFAHARVTAPDWVNAIAAKPASFDYGKAATAVLLDEDDIVVGRDGTFIHHVRIVRRLLTADGKEKAMAVLGYNTSSHRIQSFQAWLIRPTGDVLAYGKKETIDTAVFETGRELYGEGHRQHISAVEDATAGAVFAYEAVYEERSIFSQQPWFFSNDVPVECSKITLHLAEGWTAAAHTFNHDPVEPVISGTSMTWELRQLAAIKREPAAPESSAVRSWLAIDIHPPANAKSVCRKPLFSWPDISAYFSIKYDNAATPDNEMKARADALTAGCTDLKGRLAHLCLFAQKTTYVSIELNAAEGGGMIPQPASKVFKCNYGDCKDKVTLLRALLRTQGIESYPVILHAGSPLHVRPEWPSPEQFNHCILAIKVDDSIEGPALLIHPKFGRLMIFDPTVPYVPVGHLPKLDSGVLGLIIAGSDGELIQLPAAPARKYEQAFAVRLQADGSVEGSLDQHFGGQAAEYSRAGFRNLSATDFNKSIKHWLGKSLPAAEASRIEPTDDFDHAAFAVKIDFVAKAYGKPMRDTLLVFKPVIFPREPGETLRKIKRTQPVVVDPYELTENSRFELPAGFVVDELPAPVELKSLYGTYKAKLHAGENNQLILERSLQLPAALVPAADYDALRSFYEKISQAEQAPVVLRKSSATGG